MTRWFNLIVVPSGHDIVSRRCRVKTVPHILQITKDAADKPQSHRVVPFVLSTLVKRRLAMTCIVAGCDNIFIPLCTFQSTLERSTTIHVGTLFFLRQVPA